MDQLTEATYTSFTLEMVLPFRSRTVPWNRSTMYSHYKSAALSYQFKWALPTASRDIFANSVNMAEQSRVQLVGVSLIAHYQQAEEGRRAMARTRRRVAILCWAIMSGVLVYAHAQSF